MQEDAMSEGIDKIVIYLAERAPRRKALLGLGALGLGSLGAVGIRPGRGSH
jgi:hypothetical protein